MTVGIIVAALLGLGIGAGLVYWLMQQRLAAQGFQHEKELRRTREDLERDFELRMQAAIEPIQRQRDRDVAQLQAEIARLRSRPTDSSDPSSPVTAPAPAPAPVPPTPPALPDPWGGDRPTPAPTPAPESAPEPVLETPLPEPAAEIAPSPEPIAPEAPEPAAIAQIAAWSERIKRQGLRADDQKQLQEMARLTRDRDVQTRIAAIKALGLCGSPAARPILEAALRDPSLSVIRAATVALGRCRAIAPQPQPKAKAPNAKPQRPDAQDA
ncbi:MAG: hypothetical protein Fur0042_01920 [Cyanophyceae cyanobacterium]